MIVSLCRAAARVHGLARLPAFALLLTTTLAMPARADVNVRVEARPSSAPIEVYITVTDGNGDPVGGFDAADFTVTIDGDPITIADGDLTLPPVQHPNRHVSVVFTMDYSPSVVDCGACRNGTGGRRFRQRDERRRLCRHRQVQCDPPEWRFDRGTVHRNRPRREQRRARSRGTCPTMTAPAPTCWMQSSCR